MTQQFQTTVRQGTGQSFYTAPKTIPSPPTPVTYSTSDTVRRLSAQWLPNQKVLSLVVIFTIYLKTTTLQGTSKARRKCPLRLPVSQRPLSLRLLLTLVTFQDSLLPFRRRLLVRKWGRVPLLIISKLQISLIRIMYLKDLPIWATLLVAGRPE